LPRLEAVEAVVRARISELLEALTRGRADSGPYDERWYWAAGVLLDQLEDPTTARRWLLEANLAERWAGNTEDQDIAGASERSGWERHVAELQGLIREELELGRPPADLAEVLAQVALGSPGVCALRALAQIVGGSNALKHAAVRLYAGRVAMSFRTLYNVPEVIALLRGQGDDEAYWRRALEYGVDGCLSSVLEEYAHVLRESLGLLDHSAEKVAEGVAEAISDAVGLRTAQIGADEIEVTRTRGFRIRPRRLRARFAARFGDQESDDGETRSRGDQVRQAFNSPFWPFVLATTSVGQEGLDFHQYCHAVVHWNLPSNPVDLEQREGRVHRYKGHAVRKNLALKYGHAVVATDGGDVWSQMFEAAAADRPDGMRELWPYWLLPIPGGATIERHVPNFPLSREVGRFDELCRMLASYRMVFGQPRQEDLLRYLLSEVPPERLQDIVAKLRIDLAPPVGIDANRVKANLGPPLEHPVPPADADAEEEEPDSHTLHPILHRPSRANLESVRRDPDRVAEVLVHCLPDQACRRRVLDLLVEDIAEASRVNPQSWATTLYASGGWVIRLNVGMIEVLAVHGDTDVRMVVYGPRVSPEARELLRGFGLLRLERYVYSSQPMASPVVVAANEQESLIPALRQPHLELIRRAAGQVRRGTPYARHHSTGITDYLRSLGYSLPDWEAGRSAGRVRDS
jgi:hypothetical protein